MSLCRYPIFWQDGEYRKKCSMCGEIKPVADFYQIKQRGQLKTTNHCKVCQSEYKKKWHIATQAIRAKRSRRNSLRRSYGLTETAYNTMLASQDSTCAICGRPETRINKKSGSPVPLSVDHDHDTQQIRALLCNRCNVVLGKACDDPDILKENP